MDIYMSLDIFSSLELFVNEIHFKASDAYIML